MSNFNLCSNNTNKFNPQEQKPVEIQDDIVQIIQINSILKNAPHESYEILQFK